MSEIDVTKCKFHSANNGFTGAYCTAHNNYCRHIRNCYYKQLHRYKQAIEEIKEIAKLHAPMCNGCNRDEFNCDICHLYDLKNIIQKCEEVNNAR